MVLLYNIYYYYIHVLLPANIVVKKVQCLLILNCCNEQIYPRFSSRKCKRKYIELCHEKMYVQACEPVKTDWPTHLLNIFVL